MGKRKVRKGLIMTILVKHTPSVRNKQDVHVQRNEKKIKRREKLGGRKGRRKKERNRDLKQ